MMTGEFHGKARRSGSIFMLPLGPFLVDPHPRGMNPSTLLHHRHGDVGGMVSQKSEKSFSASKAN